MMSGHERGRPVDDEFERLLRDCVHGVVRRQAEAGIDVVGDGEFGKIAWVIYLSARLGGFERVDGEQTHTRSPLPTSEDRRDFAEFYAWATSDSAMLYHSSPGPMPAYECTAPVEYIGHKALEQDLSALVDALDDAPGVTEAFMPATSPGSVTFRNRYYESDQDYLFALADALNTEYRAIVDAGVILQIDDPVLPTMWDSLRPDGQRVYPDERSYLAAGELRVAAVNRALRGIPRDRVRYHICWGSWHGPHSGDVPLGVVLPLLRRLDVGGFVFEAANVRHEHEWDVWKQLGDGDDRILVPGVVSHATDLIEHPELVARRIKQFASVVGKERVIAGTDCGLGYRVHPQIAWGKLAALAEGARLASAELWGR